MIHRTELENYIGQLLEIEHFHDYCPNGLQIEGKETIRSLATAVTASRAAIRQAIAQSADALLVHHGFFWKNEAAVLVGIKKQRIAPIFAADLNVFAYHLPLDAHPTLGNNASLISLFGVAFETITPGDRDDLVWQGKLSEPISLAVLQQQISAALKRPALALGPPDKAIRYLAWCSGAAQGFFHNWAQKAIDCYLTGEISEFVPHLVEESGVAFIAAGHHATERYGIRALGEHLADHFSLHLNHIELNNPI